MISPGYRTTQQSVAIPGVNDLLIRSLLDNQQFYDPTGAAQRLGICSASWPLFGMLWPSGIQLAVQLANRPVSLNERILEIGCGLALASLVGQRRGAQITASDRHPLARKFLNKNASLNGISALKYRHGQWGTQQTPCLSDTDSELLTARYNLIIGSDLLYERGMSGMIAQFINEHAYPTAEVWMVDPGRGYSPAFGRDMAGYDFHLEQDQVLRQTQRDSNGNSLDYHGRLLIYRRYANLTKQTVT